MYQPFKIMFKLNMLALVAAFAVGCGNSDNQGQSRSADGPRDQSLPESVILAQAPQQEVANIKELKKTAQVGDEVIIRAVVGGQVMPFVENRAVMMMVDGAMHNQCTEEDDHCRSPWDYCCDDRQEVTAQSATVRFVDEEGNPLQLDLARVAQFKPLDTLVITGKVSDRPDANSLVIDATGIYNETGMQ